MFNLYRPVYHEEEFDDTLAAVLRPNERYLRMLLRAIMKAEREFFSGIVEIIDAELEDVEAATPRRQRITVR